MEAGSERVERRLAAIFATDVAGYSRLMGQDEVGTLRTLSAHREVMDRLIVEHGGRIANTAGDSVLVEFPSAADAVQCAVETQKALSALNSDKHPDRALCFRIGVHLGDVIIRGGDIFGDGVNIAARLQALTEPGGVCISGDLHRHVRKVLPLTFTNLGAQQVKNIEEPVTVYAVDLSGSAPTAAASQPKRLGPLPLPDKPSIAVLPFINMSGDPEQDYFADGVVEDIITAFHGSAGSSSSPGTPALPTRGKPLMSGRLDGSWASATSLKALSGGQVAGFGSQASSSKRPPDGTSGRIA